MQFVIFDVDGTLIDDSLLTGEENLYLNAVEQVLGIRACNKLDHYRFKTDAGILDQIIDNYEFREQRTELHKQVKAVLFNLLKLKVDNGSFKWKAMKGAKYLLENLKRKNKTLGIATGSWGSIAKLRLDSVGLQIEQIHLSSSEDGVSKYLILKHAIDTLNNNFPKSTCSFVYIGDQLEDMQASELLGIEFYGIGETFRHMPCYRGNDLSKIILD